MTNVAVIHGDERREIVKRTFELVLPEVLSKLTAASSILIKPNLVHHEHQLASTHVDAVRATLDVVRMHTQAPVTIADASYHGTKAAFRNFGYELLPTEYPRVELFDLNDDETVMGWYVKRDGTKGSMGFSKRVCGAGFTIDLTPMKMHRDVGVSLAVKNWTVGIWVPEPRSGIHGTYWPRSPFLHEQGPWAHHMTIAELLGQRKPDMAIIDGTMAMEGEGPTHGKAVPMQIALAGVDALSVDTVACELIGVRPEDIGYLVFASEKGYGVGDLNDINVIGENQWRELRRELEKPELWSSSVLAWRDRENLKLIL
jgi:uncharacterized protein (DUF362 family)